MMLNGVVHQENVPLWEQAARTAHSKWLDIRHNATTKAGWCGYHRYVALRVGAKNISCRSRDCVAYSETRHSRWYKPSVKGEREAIEDLIQQIEAL